MLFHRVENEKSVKSVKLNKYFFYSRGHVIHELIFIAIYLFAVDKKKCYTALDKKKKTNYSHLIKIFYIFLDCTWNIQNHLCILKIKFKQFPPIRFELGIRGISEKLRKTRRKSRQKAWSLFVRVETNF